MNEIEEQLWKYIDGFCAEDERFATKQLIEQNEVYRAKYAELSAFQKNMELAELEEPVMNFTFKVMENIRAEKARVPLKTRIDSRIIRGIGAFFICTILVLLVVVFANVNWSVSSNVVIKIPEIKMPLITNYLNPVVLKGFLFFDIVLGLFFFDQYFRNRLSQKK